MNKKKFTKAILVSVIVIFAVGSQVASAAAPPPNYSPMEIGDKFRGEPATLSAIAALPEGGLDQDAADAAATAAADTTSCITDAKFFIALDDYNGFFFFDVFFLMAEGTDSQIWVQADPSWPAGRGLPTPVVTCDQAAYMVGEFDNNIYPAEVAFFGAPDFRDGAASWASLFGLPADYWDDAAGRQVILVENVRDDNFYTDFPLYIAGFYSTTLDTYFDRNTMTIDAFDWENRVGPDGTRPYLYEGVFAHEYQHLLHADYDPAESNWINEGLSDWAEFLTGYGIPDSHVAAFAEKPENSLVAWGDQGPAEILTDYGMAFMYQQYMYNLYGADFIQAEFLSTQQGMASVDAVLAILDPGETFADTFHDFSAATYANEGQFGLAALDDFQIEIGPPGLPNVEAYATAGAPPWGTDYIVLNGYEQIANIRFNGYQFNPIAWTSDGSVLDAGSGDLIDNFMIAAADLSAVSGASMSFDTNYDIELDWDFGYIQVSTDGGNTWTSLSNASTTSVHHPDAHPNIIAELPGLSGNSGGWVNMSFDMSAYDGQNILVAFRYMTDWAFNGAGWQVDNVDIAGVFTSDGSSTAGFQSINQVLGISNDYTVTLIGERNRAGESEYEVLTIMSGGFVSDWESIRTLFDNYRTVIMLVTFDAAQGVTAYADYYFVIDHRGGVNMNK